MKSLVPLILFCLSMTIDARAQLSITSLNTDFTIDFDNTVVGVNNGAFAAVGFSAGPMAGQLDSDGIIVTGFSQGDIILGGTGAAGTDFGRGTSTGGENTGGIYAFDRGSSNFILGVQPSGADFTPGTMTLRFQNNTGSAITNLSVGYNIAYLNNGSNDVANGLNFSYSSDNTAANTVEVGSLDFATPGMGDALDWQVEARSVNINGLNIANGGFFFLTWTGNIESGSGTSDEYGIDDIVLNVNDITTDLIITEIMYDPSSNEGFWEWIEVYNNGSTTIDLSGFILDDDDGAAITSSNISSGSIDPGTSAILYDLGNTPTLTAAEFGDAWGDGINLIPVVTNWPVLANTSDRIGLWNFVSYNARDFTQAVEELTYNEGAGFPASNNAASIFLTDLSLDNTLASSWALSSDGAATPVGNSITSSVTSAGSNNGGADIGSPMSSIPLPVELIYFTGTHVDGQVILDWSTAQEIDNDRFEIERRSEAGDFEFVDIVPGNGNSDVIINYRNLDRTPLFGGNFYRLKQVDYDGAFEYSPTIFVEVPDDGRLRVFPNPFQERVHIRLSDNERMSSVSIFDLTGKEIVQVDQMETEGNEISFQISNTQLNQGNYLMQLITNRRKIVKRIIKN